MPIYKYIYIRIKYSSLFKDISRTSIIFYNKIMSQLKPCININPLYVTNNIDSGQAGFYQITPNSSNLATRISYSNITINGEIRLNNTVIPNVFEGYNGNSWVTFNANTGLQGIPGQDFTNIVHFINSTAAPDNSNIVTLANIFSTTYSNITANISNVYIRSLQAGTIDINSNLTIQSNILSQNSNIITITSQPIPYTWDFTSGHNSSNYLKNNSGDSQFYGWGETSKWIIATGFNILKGQAVRITNDSSNTSIVVICPVTYTSLTGISPFSTPFNMLGIALESGNGGQECIVCTKGITTVLCTSNITADFISTISVSNIGIDGIVGKDSGIFCNTTPSPLVNYIRAGYFLESGTGIATNGSYLLFYVDPKVQLG